MEKLSICFDVDCSRLVNDAVERMHSYNSESVSSILSMLVKSQFVDILDNLKTNGDILRYQQVKGLSTSSEDTDSLRKLSKCDINIKRFEATLCQNIKASRKINIISPSTLYIDSDTGYYQISGEWFIDHNYRDICGTVHKFTSTVIKSKSLKTIDKSLLRLDCYHLPKSIMQKIYSHFQKPCECCSSLLMPYTPNVWNWVVRFICRICGKTYYCSCFRDAFSRARKKGGKPQLGVTNERIPDPEDDSIYKDKICHLCRQAPSDLMYCSPMYGNSLMVRYGAYVVKTSFVIEKGKAEDEVRLRLGIPLGLKWTSEFELFAIVKELLSDYSVEYQARPKWLDKQSLDIYVPDLNIAIEYQGRQHFEPIDYFGGLEGYRKTKERDIRKADLCSDNNVVLIYFKYTDSITKTSVLKRLKRYLKIFQHK